MIEDDKMVWDYARLHARVKNLDETIIEIYAILEKNEISSEETKNVFNVVADFQKMKIIGFGNLYPKLKAKLEPKEEERKRKFKFTL